jgi:hypothetical protein
MALFFACYGYGLFMSYELSARVSDKRHIALPFSAMCVYVFVLFFSGVCFGGGNQLSALVESVLASVVKRQQMIVYDTSVYHFTGSD